ncbi:MAG: hypothetical protein K9L23_19520 [Desulfotignum sp.]|nr:hypothetical protein [Desulfotignum sp.]
MQPFFSCKKPHRPEIGGKHQWMLDELKRKGDVGMVLEDILIKAGFKYQPEK